jgi:hypothetical protein
MFGFDANGVWIDTLAQENTICHISDPTYLEAEESHLKHGAKNKQA